MAYFLLGSLYAFAAAVQPGPFQAYLISQSLAHGWRRTVLAAFAPLLSDGPIIVLVLFILSTLPSWLMHALQFAGGLFLIYLAAGAYQTWRHFNERRDEAVPSGRQNLLKAATVNLLNPNPYLGWGLVMGPLLLKGWRESPGNGVALLVGFYGSTIVLTAGIVILFSAARSLGPRVNRVLVGVSAIALAGFGLYQLWQGLALLRV